MPSIAAVWERRRALAKLVRRVIDRDQARLEP
jgi:hypothetical protein